MTPYGAIGRGDRRQVRVARNRAGSNIRWWISLSGRPVKEQIEERRGEYPETLAVHIDALDLAELVPGVDGLDRHVKTHRCFPGCEESSVLRVVVIHVFHPPRSGKSIDEMIELYTINRSRKTK